MRLTISSLLIAASAFFAANVLAEDDPTFTNTVYLIRNGEMNTNMVGSGLNETGREREGCLLGVFGLLSPRPIGYIMAEPAMSNGQGTEAIDTVSLLALTLALEVDTSCDRDDKDCVGDALSSFAAKSSASMLVCWEREYLPDIAEVLGVNDVPSWPSNSFNQIWTVENNELVSTTSENCPGIDHPLLGIL